MATISLKQAAHLMRRMGFGGNADDLGRLVGLEREAAVDSLLNHGQVDNSAMEAILRSSFDFSDPFNFARFNRSELQRWWLTRMVFTRRPFEEKMTLFWHNHFATAASKVPEIFMYIQNLLLRTRALDRFDDLLLKVAQDPAMLIWLDGLTNVKGVPNENFSRELQELFSMGITDVVTGEPNYTELDVKEIARAFTGWKAFHPRDNPDPFAYTFVVVPNEHDNLTKTVYGQTLNFSGEDIVQVIAARRATARYLVKKLFEFFVYTLEDNAADRDTIEKFANVYFDRNHSIKQLVRAIFISDEFFSERAEFGLVKSPVEFVVGAVRMSGARYNPGGFARGSNILGQLATFLGEELLNPPDVAGWKRNLGWINTSTLLNRFTFADILATGRTRNENEPGLWLLPDQLRSLAKKNSKKTVKTVLAALGPLDVGSETTGTLRSYLDTDDQGNSAPFKKNDASIDKKVRGLVHLVMCLTEFQLN
jgi:uncharacterized protein (DUF1800 family)